MQLSDEQLVEALRDRGHDEAATALEQKLTAEAAVAGLPAIPHDAPVTRATAQRRMARGFAASDPARIRAERKGIRQEDEE